MNITEFRQQYPQYSAIPDDQLAERLYQKHYAGKIAREDFDAKFLGAVPPPAGGPTDPPQEEGFLARLGREVSNAMVGNITTSKAMAQGLPGVGGWTDEIAGKVMAAIHGGDAEQHRKDYMAPVEAMPKGRRFAAELAGGVVGSAPLAGLGIPAAIAASTGLGAVSGAGLADGGAPGSRLLGGAVGAGAGALTGVLAPVAAGMTAGVASRGANAIRSLMGRPTNPYIGRGGRGAQEVLRKSIDNAADMGAPPPTATAPLLAQQPTAAASQSVLAGAGKPAAQLVGAAKEAAADDSALKAAGNAYQDRLGIVPLSAATTPDVIAASPSVSSNAISAILGNKDMKPILSKIARDTAFEGIPENNLTLLHHAKGMLAERVRQARRAGKVTETAGRLGRLHKQFEDALDAAAPGYKAVNAEYAEAAAARMAQKEAAKLAGSEKKFVPVEAAGPGVSRLLAESISGSLPGVQMRAAIASGAHATQAVAKAARGAEARRLAEILAEKDPDKIAMALRMLRKDMSGKPFRWPLMYQGPTVLSEGAK